MRSLRVALVKIMAGFHQSESFFLFFHSLFLLPRVEKVNARQGIISDPVAVYQKGTSCSSSNNSEKMHVYICIRERERKASTTARKKRCKKVIKKFKKNQKNQSYLVG